MASEEKHHHRFKLGSAFRKHGVFTCIRKSYPPTEAIRLLQLEGLDAEEIRQEMLRRDAAKYLYAVQ